MNKEEMYRAAIGKIGEKIKGLDRDELVAKMATASAILKDTFPHYLWCGFYFVEEPEMVVGPYEGKPACAKIEYHGVCGKAAKLKQTVIVPDVHKFPGHIVCDERSKSEIVIPVFAENNELIAVMDIDSDKINAFDETDKKFLEKLTRDLMQ